MDYEKEQKEREAQQRRYIKLGIGGFGLFVVLVLILINLPFIVIPAGSRGVVFNNRTGVENRILGEGVHFRTPFVESVTKMSVRTQATQFDENAGTRDSQSVDMKVTVNWHLDPAYVNQIYQNIGNLDQVQSKILTNATQDSIKAAASKYEALDIQRNRDNVANVALTTLQKKLAKDHIIVDNLSLTNINFTADFNAAVEQAQVAQQKAKQAQYDVQRVKNEAESAIARANGEAEAQRQVQQTLTPELLQKMWIEKWNGNLPSTMAGGDTSLFLGLNK